MYCHIVREYVALQKFKDRLGFRETHHSIIVHVFFINWVYQQSIDSGASPLHVTIKLIGFTTNQIIYFFLHT